MANSINIEKKEFLGSGWSFPVRFSWNSAELALSQYEKNIEENMQVLLNTKRGEHQLEQLFGLGMQQFMFRRLDETLKGEIIDTIKTTLLHYEPRIKVLSVDVVYEDLTEGLISIAIDYEYIKTNTRHNYVFPYHLNEATNKSRGMR